MGKEKCLVGNDIIVIKYKQNPKYLAYALSSGFCKKQIEGLSVESTVFHLYSSKIKQIKIPIPPKDVQDKIANYLDKFYELERELEDREKQCYLYHSKIQPMPEPGNQDKVSEILNKFHTLTEDIISGIPGLIKDNRERYEYYRDRIFEI